jgi:hypothetical protein
MTEHLLGQCKVLSPNLTTANKKKKKKERKLGLLPSSTSVKFWSFFQGGEKVTSNF